MTLRIGQIALHSKDNKTLASFLSELLDLDISFSGEAVRLSNDLFTIIIIEDKSVSVKNSMVIDFFTDSNFSLSSLLNSSLLIKNPQVKKIDQCEKILKISLRRIIPYKILVNNAVFLQSMK